MLKHKKQFFFQMISNRETNTRMDGVLVLSSNFFHIYYILVLLPTSMYAG